MRFFLIRLALKLVKFKWVEAPKWTQDDVNLFISFLSTSTGQKFYEILRNMACDQDSYATQQKNNLEWACGCASGFRLCIQAMRTLTLPVTASPQESYNDDNDSAGELWSRKQ